MPEPFSNIVVLKQGYKTLDLSTVSPESLIGKYVKKGFTAIYKGQAGKEWMWVHIKKVVDGILVGQLDNDPVFADLNLGDEVQVKMNEICDIIDS